MTYQDFFAALKSQAPKGTYLFDGEDEWSMQRGESAIVQKALGNSDQSVGVTHLETLDPDTVRAACMTVSLWGDKRVVICPNALACVQALSKKQMTGFLQVLEALEEHCVLLLTQAGAKLRWPKALLERVCHVTFEGLTDTDKMRFVTRWCKDVGISIEKSAALELVRRVQDMQAIENATNKLVALAKEGTIDRRTVCEQVTASIEYDVFAMLDAFFAGKSGQGMRDLDGLLKKDAHALQINALMAMRIRQMLRAKALMQEGVRAQDLPRRMGVAPFVARKATQSAKRYSVHWLERAYNILLQADTAIKSRSIPDALILQQAVARIFLVDAPQK